MDVAKGEKMKIELRSIVESFLTGKLLQQFLLTVKAKRKRNICSLLFISSVL